MNCIVLLFVVHCFHGAIRFRRVQDRWFKPHARLRVGSQWYWGVATAAGTHGHINFFETFTAGAQQDKIKYLPQKVYAHKLFPAHQQHFCRFGILMHLLRIVLKSLCAHVFCRQCVISRRLQHWRPLCFYPCLRRVGGALSRFAFNSSCCQFFFIYTDG